MVRRRPLADRLPALAVAAALAALAASARAADAVPASGGTLRIVAEPRRLVLGRDAGADLRIAAPAEVEDVALSASAGSIEAVRRLPGGGFAARYRPPAARFPQVAIVSALARTGHGLLDGWLALPLSGQGDAHVHAAPGAQVALRIGDETFGPRVAGADGVAVIPVVVPPGVREGHQGFTPVDLHVPETALLHAVVDRASVRADRPESVRVLAYVVAPHGTARRGDAPALEASRGSVALVAREPGAFEGTWTLPPGGAGEVEDRLVVRLPGSPASRVVLRVERTAGAVEAPPGVAAADPERLLAPRPASSSASVWAGVAADARGRFVGPRVGLAAELAGPGGTLPLAWRLEAEALAADPGGAAGVDRLLAGALLAGGALHGDVRRVHVWASATAGALLARARPSAPGPGVAPAGRLAVGAALPLRPGAPYLEASVLAASGGPAGAFAAFGLSAGFRFDLEGVPWRRSSSSTTSP
ncbi:hypothetical protein [Anaeromyxobacter oryzisoli]|uniref:hypothetical protein n=1 Tax=Anaeromyxobacter oryzisoli TaxID=2925408 RepID=UPI001F59C4BD|nr:hypothetical protein [Anaeromyxobacter sp. SG63]